MKTLIVWQLIPEETHGYILPEEVAKEHEAMLTRAAGQYINASDDTVGVNYLSLALMDPEALALMAPEHKSEGCPDYAGSLHQYKIEGELDELFFDGPVRVIFTGMVM